MFVYINIITTFVVLKYSMRQEVRNEPHKMRLFFYPYFSKDLTTTGAVAERPATSFALRT